MGMCVCAYPSPPVIRPGQVPLWVMWRPKLSHKHFTIRVTYPDKCFVLFIIRVTYPVVRATYPDKEVKRLHWEAPWVTAPPAGSLWKFITPVKVIHHASEEGRLHWGCLHWAARRRPLGPGPNGLVLPVSSYFVSVPFPPHLAFL